jgi:hypothetical protein
MALLAGAFANGLPDARSVELTRALNVALALAQSSALFIERGRFVERACSMRDILFIERGRSIEQIYYKSNSQHKMLA